MHRNKKVIASFVLGAILLLAGGYFAYGKYAKMSGKKVIENGSIANIAQKEEAAVFQEEKNVNEEKVANDSQKSASNIETQENTEQKTLESETTKKTVLKEQTTLTEKNGNYDVVSNLISWGFQKSSGRKIDTIIVHSSYDALGSDPYDVQGIIAEYKQYGVSAHYLIARDGKIFQLVADQNIAWHAGESKMPDGRTNVNAFSIGIEMIDKQDGTFTNDQYGALNQLIASLKKKYSIKYVLGHKDIAPGRKTDPWGIEWSKVDK